MPSHGRLIKKALVQHPMRQACAVTQRLGTRGGRDGGCLGRTRRAGLPAGLGPDQAPRNEHEFVVAGLDLPVIPSGQCRRFDQQFVRDAQAIVGVGGGPGGLVPSFSLVRRAAEYGGERRPKLPQMEGVEDSSGTPGVCMRHADFMSAIVSSPCS